MMQNVLQLPDEVNKLANVSYDIRSLPFQGIKCLLHCVLIYHFPSFQINAYASLFR